MLSLPPNITGPVFGFLTVSSTTPGCYAQWWGYDCNFDLPAKFSVVTNSTEFFKYLADSINIEILSKNGVVATIPLAPIITAAKLKSTQEIHIDGIFSGIHVKMNLNWITNQYREKGTFQQEVYAVESTEITSSLKSKIKDLIHRGRKLRESAKTPDTAILDATDPLLDFQGILDKEQGSNNPESDRSFVHTPEPLALNTTNFYMCTVVSFKGAMRFTQAGQDIFRAGNVALKIENESRAFIPIHVYAKTAEFEETSLSFPKHEGTLRAQLIKDGRVVALGKIPVKSAGTSVSEFRTSSGTVLARMEFSVVFPCSGINIKITAREIFKRNIENYSVSFKIGLEPRKTCSGDSPSISFTAKVSHDESYPVIIEVWSASGIQLLGIGRLIVCSPFLGSYSVECIDVSRDVTVCSYEVKVSPIGKEVTQAIALEKSNSLNYSSASPLPSPRKPILPTTREEPEVPVGKPLENLPETRTSLSFLDEVPHQTLVDQCKSENINLESSMKDSSDKVFHEEKVAFIQPDDESELVEQFCVPAFISQLDAHLAVMQSALDDCDEMGLLAIHEKAMRSLERQVQLLKFGELKLYESDAGDSCDLHNDSVTTNEEFSNKIILNLMKPETWTIYKEAVPLRIERFHHAQICFDKKPLSFTSEQTVILPKHDYTRRDFCQSCHFETPAKQSCSTEIQTESTSVITSPVFLHVSPFPVTESRIDEKISVSCYTDFTNDWQYHGLVSTHIPTYQNRKAIKRSLMADVLKLTDRIWRDSDSDN
jgi:hypothetical protein